MLIVFPTDLLVYRSAIYPQWETFKYGLGGRLQFTLRAAFQDTAIRQTDHQTFMTLLLLQVIDYTAISRCWDIPSAQFSMQAGSSLA